jgi:UPF0716 protein FxsA
VRLGKRIAVGFLLLWLAELVAFGLVAWAVGLFAAIALMGLTSLAGGLVLRRAGRGHMARFRVMLRGRPIAEPATGGGDVLLAAAGILLLLPGFITDLMGAGLLIGPLRRWLGATIGRAIGRARTQTGAGSVIDLAADEWRPVPDHEQPKPDWP